MTRARASSIVLAFPLAVLLGCPPSKLPEATVGGVVKCGGLDEKACKQAEGLTAAASRFSNVDHDFVLDATGSFAPGRGLEKLTQEGAAKAGAAWRVVPTECAHPKKTATEDHAVAAQTIDYSFVGVSVDDALVGADADLSPYASVGGSASRHRLKLLAVAFVRDTDPQFFEGTDALASDGTTCSCGRASHFVGAVKFGGVLSYEVSIDAGELHGSAIGLMKAKLAAKDVKIDEVRIGGLRLEGLTEATAGEAKPISFVVEKPVPVAYAAYPVADVCRFALPAPEVGPNPVEFGTVPYGKEATKYVHVQNRAKIELRATLDGETYAIPPEGSLDVPVRYKAVGDAPFCDAQEKEATLAFVPADPKVPASPKQQTVKLVLHATSGKEKFTATAHIDTGEARRPDYAATERVLSCPKDYFIAGCHVQNASCGGDGDTRGPGTSVEGCTTGGYGVRAETYENGCKFSCSGPNSVLLASNFCRFDAVADCRLRCK